MEVHSCFASLLALGPTWIFFEALQAWSGATLAEHAVLPWLRTMTRRCLRATPCGLELFRLLPINASFATFLAHTPARILLVAFHALILAAEAPQTILPFVCANFGASNRRQFLATFSLCVIHHH